MKKYHLDYENSTSKYSVKDQYKNEFNSLYDRIYKKLSTRPVYEEEKKNTSKFNVSLADLIKSIEDSKTKPVSEDSKEQQGDQTLNADSFKWTKDAVYYKSVLSALGAKDSNNSDALTAYNYFNDPANKGKEIPEEIKNAVCGFISSVNNKIADYKDSSGKDLKGLRAGDIIPEGVAYAGSEVSQGFNDPTTKQQGHMAYDIQIPGGTDADIHPILDGGVVVYVNDKNGPKDGNGRVVVVEYDLGNGFKYYTSFSHLSSVSFKYTEDDLKNKTIKVGKDFVLGKQGGSSNGDEHAFGGKKGDHLHLMVYIASDNKEDPLGYASDKVKYINGEKIHILNFEQAGCIYGPYWCITPSYPDWNYNNIVFFDPYIVMLTNGEIIKLFAKK